MVPATCEPALPAPVSIPAARFSSNDVGGAVLDPRPETSGIYEMSALQIAYVASVHVQ